MATFRVGQRVRVIGPAGCRWLGRQAVIAAEMQTLRMTNGQVVDAHDLSVDGLGVYSPDGNLICAKPENLEPIQYDGMQPAKWEDCMWQPSAELIAECAA